MHTQCESERSAVSRARSTCLAEPMGPVFRLLVVLRIPVQVVQDDRVRPHLLSRGAHKLPTLSLLDIPQPPSPRSPTRMS